jgi:hypothetical protein
MRRVATVLSVEAARLVFAVVVGYGAGRALESTCPAPTPENSSPGCEGPSLLFGGFVGFLGAILLTIVAEWLWRRRRVSRTGGGAERGAGPGR